VASEDDVLMASGPGEKNMALYEVDVIHTLLFRNVQYLLLS